MKVLKTNDLCFVSGGDSEGSYTTTPAHTSSACTVLGASLWSVASMFGWSGGRTLATQVTNSCNTAVSNWTSLVNKSPNAISANDAH
jgi:hypothetical protein